MLCLIAFSEIGCSRRTARGVRLPSAAEFRRDRGSARNSASTNEMRGAIDSLRNKLQDAPQSSDTAAAEGTGVVSQSGGASTPSAGVGTSGALSVETRYPAESGSRASQPRSSGHLLSRTGYALQRAARGASAWVIVLCALAAGLIVLLLLRRSHTSA